jgi:hypothetical protein
MSLLLSWEDTLRHKPEKASSVVGIDYEVRMELIAQPWAAGELLGPSSLPHTFPEDTVSLSDRLGRVQFKKSIATMKRECVLW